MRILSASDTGLLRFAGTFRRAAGRLAAAYLSFVRFWDNELHHPAETPNVLGRAFVAGVIAPVPEVLPFLSFRT